MRIFSLIMAVVLTVQSFVPFTVASTYYIDRYGWAQDLADGLQQFIYDGAGAIRDLIEVADTNPWLDGNNSLTRSGNPSLSPSVAYYNESVNTTSYDMRTYTYNQQTYNTELNNYQMIKNDYDYNYDMRTYTYNPIYNDYRTYNYRTYNQYTFYDDDEYYYISENNITNQNFYVISKIDVNDNRFYSYYFKVNDTPSWNLTVDDLLGIYFNHNNYNYTKLVESSDTILGLWRLDGNYVNEVGNDVQLHYSSSSFVDGLFDGGLKTDVYGGNVSSDLNMIIDGFDEDSYTVEFWFYNTIQNGTYDQMGSPYAWHHCAYVYNKSLGSNDIDRNRQVKVYIDGVFTNRRAYFMSWDIFQQMQNGTKAMVGETLPTNLGVLNSRYKGIVPYFIKHYVNGNVVNYGYVSQGVDGSLFPNILSYNSSAFSNFNDIKTSLIYSPVHYEPELYNNNVYFGFTDNCLSGHFYTYSKTNLYDYKINPSAFSGFGYHKYLNLGVDMSDCIIDEMRLSKGVLYDSNFTPPLSRFDLGFQWISPAGTNYNFGDMAYQTSYDVTDVRIGGAMYTYPVVGNVYINVNNNGVGGSAAIYNGQTWEGLDYAVWNGYQWQDGKNFNFRNLTFYDVAVDSGQFDNDDLRAILDKLGIIDESLGEGNDLLRQIVALLTTPGTVQGVEYTLADLENLGGSSIDAYDPLNDTSDTVQGSLGSTLIGWKDILLPFIIGIILLAIVLKVFKMVIDISVWVATLFSVQAVPTMSYDFNKGVQWFQGVPYTENGVTVDPFYVFTFGNVHFTLFDFAVIIFNIVFIGAVIKLGKRLIGNIKMKGE